ncbi:hypothetical protein ACWJJH_06080 [Endozoicomonadaceae bacterium StTr2]
MHWFRTDNLFPPVTSLPLLASLIAVSVSAGPREQWYQSVWCDGKGGKSEVLLEDHRRIDCLTDTHAIEVEFARKWPEAIGQSLGYARSTGRQAGIVLVLKKPGDEAYWNEMNAVIDHFKLPITVWKLGP